MSCGDSGYCCGNANCNTCEGRKISDFASSTTIPSGALFTMVTGSGNQTSNINVTFETLKNALKAVVPETDLSNYPDGTILQIQSGLEVASSIREDADYITFGKDILIPSGTLKLENCADVHNIGNQLGLSGAGSEYVVAQYLIDSSGATNPTFANVGVEALTPIQTTDTSSLSGVKITFPLTLSGSGQAWKINHMRLRGNAATSGVRIVVSKNSAPLVDNSNIVFEYPSREQWIDGAGFDFQVGDFTIDTDPLMLNSDDSFYVTFEVTVGSGDTIDLKSDGTTPFLQIDAQSGPLESFTVGGIQTQTKPVVAGNLPVYTGVTGNLVDDSGFDPDDLKGLHVVHINADSDFDAYTSGGKINLNTGADFIIHGFRSHSLPIVFGNGSKILGLNRFNDFLNFTGTGNQFEYSGTGSCSFAEIGFIATGQNCLSVTGTGNETIVFTNCYIVTCATAGTFDNVRTIVFRSFSLVAATDGTNGGFVITSTTPGLTGAFNMDNSLFQGVANGIALDFQATQMNRIQIPNGNRFVVDAGTTGVNVLASNGNFAASGVGVITGNLFEGAGTRLNGHSAGDVQWRVDPSNIGIQSTRKQAQGSITGNVLQNTFGGGLNVPEKLNLGALFVPDASIQEQFTMDNTGRTTYDGVDPASVYIDATMFCIVGGGLARQYIFYIYHYDASAATGAIITSSRSKREYTGSNPGSHSCKSVVTMETGDYLEIWLEAITATTALTPDTVSITVRADL